MLVKSVTKMSCQNCIYTYNEATESSTLLLLGNHCKQTCIFHRTAAIISLWYTQALWPPVKFIIFFNKQHSFIKEHSYFFLYVMSIIRDPDSFKINKINLLILLIATIISIYYLLYFATIRLLPLKHDIGNLTSNLWNYSNG